MKTVIEAGAWWLALVGVYVMTLSAPSVPELVAGAAVAAGGAAAALAARRAMRGEWRARGAWARRLLSSLLSLPWLAVRDSVTALITVFRDPDAGYVETLRLPEESPSALAARQAVATIAIGCTPGTMVIAAPEREPVLVLHRLFSGRSPILDGVRR